MQARPDDPEEILRVRFARGEIPSDEFELRLDLQTRLRPPSAPPHGSGGPDRQRDPARHSPGGRARGAVPPSMAPGRAPWDDRPRMDVIIFAVGLALVGLVLWDVFETIVVPRPTPGRWRLAKHLTIQTWRAWRAACLRVSTGLQRELLLGIYAPALVVLLVLVWMVLLVLGYGLVFFALRAQLSPPAPDLGVAVYFAGSSILTLGFGDVLAVGGAARIVTITAAATGLGVVALGITYLFSLFGSFQRREILVVTLAARAGAPPSAVTLLETYARLGLTGELPVLFADWERWSAEVLDSHVAYPILGYFRSSHDNSSWVSALGAVLDSACFVLTTIRGVPRGQAELAKRVGAHFVEDIANYLGFGPVEGSGVDRAAFDEAYERLADAGYELEDAGDAWSAFERARATYAARLGVLADYWAVSGVRWTAERTATASAAHERAGSATPR
ncbi:MAG: ion channel [Candidatus Limnocylindrales bacterium]